MAKKLKVMLPAKSSLKAADAEFEPAYDEQAAKCGYKKLDYDLDPFDRERNPLGGLKSSSGFMNRQTIDMDWDAQGRKDKNKSAKLPKR